MRLYLITALLAAQAAHAGGHAGTRVDTYDDGWMHVVLPAASAGYEAKKWGVEGDLAADFLSGATQVFVADGVSAATTYAETRTDGGLSAQYHPKKTWQANAGFTHGQEPDYRSTTGSGGGEIELFERMSTLSGTYTLGLERVRRATDPFFEELRWVHTLDAGWDQILDKNTTVEGRLEIAIGRHHELLGRQESPGVQTASQKQQRQESHRRSVSSRQ